MSRLALLLSLAAAIAAAQETHPPLATRTLSDREFVIPTDLPPGPAVLIVGFTQASKTQTSAWSQQLTDLTPVFQVAILEDVPSLLRRFVIGGIKSGIPEALRDRFLIVTQGTPAWKALCSSAREDEACVLLLAGDRQIVWRGHGNATEQSTNMLREQIAGLKGQS
jgi:hypothetical protein